MHNMHTFLSKSQYVHSWLQHSLVKFWNMGHHSWIPQLLWKEKFYFLGSMSCIWPQEDNNKIPLPLLSPSKKRQRVKERRKLQKGCLNRLRYVSIESPFVYDWLDHELQGLCTLQGLTHIHLFLAALVYICFLFISNFCTWWRSRRKRPTVYTALKLFLFFISSNPTLNVKMYPSGCQNDWHLLKF